MDKVKILSIIILVVVASFPSISKAGITDDLAAEASQYEQTQSVQFIPVFVGDTLYCDPCRVRSVG